MTINSCIENELKPNSVSAGKICFFFFVIIHEIKIKSQKKKKNKNLVDDKWKFGLRKFGRQKRLQGGFETIIVSLRTIREKIEKKLTFTYVRKSTLFRFSSSY